MKVRRFTRRKNYQSLSPVRKFSWLPALLVAVGLATASNATTIIDVTSHGAFPNDSIDDSSAIQRAIDTAPDNSTVYFPRGVYLVAGLQISHRTGLTLAGEGAPLTILKRNGNYPNIAESVGSTDLLITNLAFDANGITAFGGFNFYNAKRITITKTHFFDSKKQPVGGYDRYSWVFGRGSVPSEDILIRDNLIEDLQLEVDFGLRVRIEGNTVVRPVQTAGIGVFTINDHSSADDYTIQNNTIADPMVSAGGIVVHLDPPSSSYSRMRTFRILDNQIVYTNTLAGSGASAIRLGTGDNSKTTIGNIFDDIIIQNNLIYKDPEGPYDFGDINSIIFGNTSAIANFKFDNTNVSDNRIYYNNTWGLPLVDIREKGRNYVENNNRQYAVSSDIMPPSAPTAPANTYVSDTELHLAWNPSVDNIGVYRYRIYRNGIAIGYSSTNSYVDKNLLASSVFTYTVTAVDAAGNESAQSFMFDAKTNSTDVAATTSTPTSSIDETPTIVRGRGRAKGMTKRR